MCYFITKLIKFSNFRHIYCKILPSRFTHIFRHFFWAMKLAPPIFLLLECMMRLACILSGQSVELKLRDGRKGRLDQADMLKPLTALVVPVCDSFSKPVFHLAVRWKTTGQPSCLVRINKTLS